MPTHPACRSCFPSARAQRGTHKAAPSASCGPPQLELGPSAARRVGLPATPQARRWRSWAGWENRSADGAGPAGWGLGPDGRAGRRSYRGQSAGGACSQPQLEPEPEPEPAPPCPWPSAAARTTRPPTGWTRASSTTVASWTRSTWCRTSSCSSSPSPFSSSVSARGEQRRRGGRWEGGRRRRRCAPQRSASPCSQATAARLPLGVPCPVLCPAVPALTHPHRPHSRGVPETARTTTEAPDPGDPQVLPPQGQSCGGERRKQGSLYALDRSGGGRAVTSEALCREPGHPPPRHPSRQPQLGPGRSAACASEAGWRPCEPCASQGLNLTVVSSLRQSWGSTRPDREEAPLPQLTPPRHARLRSSISRARGRADPT